MAVKKIILLAQDRMFAQRALNSLAKSEASNDITVDSIVSDHSLYSVAKKTLKRDIFWLNNDNRNEDVIAETISSRKIDIAISLQHKWIISKEIIDAVNGKAFNTHFGKLPEYRGHCPHIHAMLNGEKSVTTTLHYIIPKVDMGDIIFEAETPILDIDTSWSIWEKSVVQALILQDKLLEYLASGKTLPRQKVFGEPKFYNMDDIMGLKEIKDHNDPVEVDRKSRAFYYPPHEPAYFKMNNKKYYVIPKPSYEE